MWTLWVRDPRCCAEAQAAGPGHESRSSSAGYRAGQQSNLVTCLRKDANGCARAQAAALQERPAAATDDDSDEYGAEIIP